MSVTFNPTQPKQTLATLSDARAPVAAQHSLSTRSSLSSMAINQGAGEPAKPATPATASKEDVNRSFCGWCWHIATMPFRFVADCFMSIWNCLTSSCRSDKPADAADAAGKVDKTKTADDAEVVDKEKAETTAAFKNLPLNSFESAVRGRKADDDCKGAFSALHGTVAEEMTDCVYTVARREGMAPGPRKEFDHQAAIDLVDAGNREFMTKVVTQHRASSLLGVQLGKVKAINPDKAGKEEDRAEACRVNKERIFDALVKSTGADRTAGQMAQGALRGAVYAMTAGNNVSDVAHVQEADTDCLYEETVGVWGHAVKDAWDRLATNGLHLLKTKKDREVLNTFTASINGAAVGGVMERPVSAAEVKFAVARLKRESSEAYRLLMSQIAFSKGASDHKIGEAFIEFLDDMQASDVARCALCLNDFENGIHPSDAAALREAPEAHGAHDGLDDAHGGH